MENQNLSMENISCESDVKEIRFPTEAFIVAIVMLIFNIIGMIGIVASMLAIGDFSLISAVNSIISVITMVVFIVVLRKKEINNILFYSVCGLALPTLISFVSSISIYSFLSLIGRLVFVLSAGAFVIPQLAKFKAILEKKPFLPVLLYLVIKIVGKVISLSSYPSDYGFEYMLTDILTNILFGVLPWVLLILFFTKWCLNPYKKEKPVNDFTPPAIENGEGAVTGTVLDYADAHCDLVKHILLSLFTCGIWLFVWIYKTTKVLNKAPNSEQYDPTKKLLLCMFIPFYTIYWIYKHGMKIDKLNEYAGRTERNATLFLILGIFIPIVAVILMQDNINKLCTATACTTTPPATQDFATSTPPSVSGADELKKFKELLDMGAITQEEYDAKKKELLGL